MPAFFLAFGFLLVWTISYFFSWRMTAFLSTIPSMLQLLLMIPLPETPYWLIENEEFERAKKSMKFFRGKDYDISEEIHEIHKKHESKRANMPKKSWKFVMGRLFSNAFFKPFSCIGVVAIVGTWTGYNSLMVYMTDIFRESASTLDPQIGVIFVGALRLPFAGDNFSIFLEFFPQYQKMNERTLSQLSILCC